VCDRLACAYNSCDGIAVEGTANHFNFNLFFHVRYRGEGHGFVTDFVAASGNLLQDFVFDGGYGLRLSGDAQHEVTGNTILMGEVRGGRGLFFGNATGNTMRNVGFIGPRPTQGSRFGIWGDSVSPPVMNEPVITNFANNIVDYQPPNGGTVKFARLLDGWQPTD
jgi:hypothetical protein